MFQEEAFLKAILAEPDADAPRLVYADWLEEQGQTGRAEFLRVQSKLGDLPEGDGQRKELATKARELLRVHRDEWLAADLFHLDR